ncbi:hypothetical protein Q3G72_008874 [Acer saccharum]|nr:hypothetical protein Q3G72_008874 [Acer saccharum]
MKKEKGSFAFAVLLDHVPCSSQVKRFRISDVEYVDGGDGFDSVDGGVIDDYVLGLILLMMVMKFLNFWVAFILTLVMS